MSNKMIEDIGRVAKKLMYKEPFYGLFLISLNKNLSERLEKGGVSRNGINCQLDVNPKYWDSLSQEHKEGFLKHNLLHIAFQHMNMLSRYDDKEVFDMACDLEANQYISPETLPEGSILPKDFPDLKLPAKAGVKSYYDIFYKAKLQQDPQVAGALGEQGDDHSNWGEFGEGSEAEQDLTRRQIDYQLREVYNQAKSMGRIPAELEDYIKSLFEVKKQVFNWKAYLRRFVSGANRYYTKKTRRKLNKRFVGNPAIKVKPKAKILVAVDTSGSVSEKELHDFFSEVVHIYKCGVHVDIVECDARMYDAYEFTGTWNGKVHGRGGTSFQPVIDFYDKNRKKYNTLIYFTDGECSAPTKPRNSMLWVISSNITDFGRKQFDFLPWFKFIIPAEAT
jgi:predicted metal-dependent peptidase